MIIALRMVGSSIVATGNATVIGIPSRFSSPISMKLAGDVAMLPSDPGAESARSVASQVTDRPSNGPWKRSRSAGPPGASCSSASSRTSLSALGLVHARVTPKDQPKQYALKHQSPAGNLLVRDAPLHGRTLWEASPLGDLTAENLRPEAGLPQGRPLGNRGNLTTCGSLLLIENGIGSPRRSQGGLRSIVPG